MKLTRLHDQRVIISRLMPVTGTNKLAMATVTSIYGHLQPAAPNMVQLVGGVYGKTYRFWCDGEIDIAEGDQFKDESGAIYTVSQGGVVRQTHGAMDFKEVICQRKSE